MAGPLQSALQYQVIVPHKILPPGYMTAALIYQPRTLAHLGVLAVPLGL